jgi:hypothetical protein
MAHMTSVAGEISLGGSCRWSGVVVDNDRIDRETILLELGGAHPMTDALLGFELLRTLSL